MTVEKIIEYVDNMYLWSNSMADMAVSKNDYGLMKYWKGQAAAYKVLLEIIGGQDEVK